MQLPLHIGVLALDVLAKAYEEKGMLNCHVSLEHLIKETGVTKEVLLYNLLLLADLDYVEAPFHGYFKITYKGLDAVEEWRQIATTLVEEFERISEMKPQPRGRALQ
jgi:hypothetical protein